MRVWPREYGREKTVYSCETVLVFVTDIPLKLAQIWSRLILTNVLNHFSISAKVQRHQKGLWADQVYVWVSKSVMASKWLKHGSIITGCWAIHGNVHTLFRCLDQFLIKNDHWWWGVYHQQQGWTCVKEPPLIKAIWLLWQGYTYMTITWPALLWESS